MKNTLSAAVFFLLAATALTAPAQAQDVPPVVSAIFKSWETQLRATPAYDKIETDSSGNVTISNLAATVGVQDPTTTVKLTIGSIVLENVAAEADGLIAVGNATFSDTKVEFAGPDNKSVVIEIPKSGAEDWFVAVAGDNPTPLQAFRASMGIAKKMTSGEIKVTAEGQSFTAKGVETAWSGDPVTGSGKTTMSLTDLVIPEAALAMMDPSGQLKALGYSEIILNMTGDGELSVAGDNFGMTGTFGVSSKDMAGFTFSYGASEIPLAVMAEMQAAQKTGRPPDFNMLMPQLMNVSLSGFKIRFEDASITKKVLPLIARTQGMDEAAMVANAGAMMQLSLMQLKNQAFTDQVVSAVNAFLKDPKSFTVSFQPAAPVKVQQLMTLDPANPGAAVDVLGVSVSAND
ncbi:MAG TPA: hypothetical protein VM144_08485 [Aestuariivirga sp.]|nr:hypothetical protein [Aestuariivirga sp.]